MSKDGIVVLTHIAWAAIVVSAHKVSQDLQLRCGIAVPRFIINKIKSLWQLEVTLNLKNMKRILSIVFTLVISISLFAQKDVTKFMGIPVDGFKPAMIKKLKEKGFVSTISDKVY